MANVVINEWLPNPTGNDATGEFVELYNSGGTPINVNGWTLATLGKKKAKINGVVPAHGYLLLDRKQTKLVLKNSDEGVALYDAAGKLIDKSSFIGSAPDGKSFGRQGDVPQPARSCGTSQVCPTEVIQRFAWEKPTPGAINEAVPIAVARNIELPIGVPINHPEAGMGVFFLMMMGVAVLLAGLVVYSMKTNENLSDIFFNRDEAVG
jgi:hypothetical protein